MSSSAMVSPLYDIKLNNAILAEDKHLPMVNVRSGERPIRVQDVGEPLTHSPYRLDMFRAVGGHPPNGCHALLQKIAALLRMQAREVDVQISGRRS
ncbi:hypothetical protein Taro_027397 [Colocasia esculenta]|uniref:Uncharacterized protein n=1 Tax=Colocasia esculenta TaxID=4460 RepID=A0A843VNK9_COLES|nr:hypothetical protein [Colocasia esculenta]